MKKDFLKEIRSLQQRTIDLYDDIVDLLADSKNEEDLQANQEEIEYLQEQLEKLQYYLKLCER